MQLRLYFEQRIIKMVTEIAKKSLATPLGQILEEAGLVSSYQVDVALRDQVYNANLLIGEILALRGWIDQETADFFAVDFPLIQKQQQRELIGTYLARAKLLTKEQIDSILEEQEVTLIPFVSIAVLKGYLKQKTLNFLEENLFKDSQLNYNYLSHPFYSKSRLIKRHLYENEVMKTKKSDNYQPKQETNPAKSIDPDMDDHINWIG
jgi:hypothetical protein